MYLNYAIIKLNIKLSLKTVLPIGNVIIVIEYSIFINILCESSKVLIKSFSTTILFT